MPEKAETIPQSTANTDAATRNLKEKEAAAAGDSLWYVLRYKTLSNRTRIFLTQQSERVFFPHRVVRTIREAKKGSAKTEYAERPLVPGYIFVHGTLAEALKLSEEVELRLWWKRTPDNTFCGYQTISDSSMRVFKRAVELSLQDFKLLDAGCIDLTADDFVEITAEGFNHIRGHIKYVNKKNDGIVVVPLKDDDDDLQNTLFHYGIPVSSSDVAIISFAQGSRRATDLLNHAGKVVDGILEEYRQGKPLTSRQEQRLAGYVHRFRQLELDRPIQRIRHALMFYRIYTVMELDAERDKMRRLLEEELLPECERRRDKASDRDKASAEKTYSEYLTLKAEADTAYKARQKALSHLAAKPSAAKRTKEADRLS